MDAEGFDFTLFTDTPSMRVYTGGADWVSWARLGGYDPFASSWMRELGAIPDRPMWSPAVYLTRNECLFVTQSGETRGTARAVFVLADGALYAGDSLFVTVEHPEKRGGVLVVGEHKPLVSALMGIALRVVRSLERAPPSELYLARSVLREKENPDTTSDAEWIEWTEGMERAAGVQKLNGYLVRMEPVDFQGGDALPKSVRAHFDYDAQESLRHAPLKQE